MPKSAARAVATVAKPVARVATRRKAPAHDVAHTARAPRVALPIVACIDGGCEPIGSHFIGERDAAHELAETVIATLLGHDYGNKPVALVSVELVAPGLFAATFVVGKTRATAHDHVVFFGTADDVPADADDAPEAAPAPVSAEQPANGRPAKRLPAPAVAAALKASAAIARAENTVVRVRVTFENAGSYDVRASLAELNKPAEFVKLYVCQRAAQYHEWARVAIDYASLCGVDSYSAAVSFGAKRQLVYWGEVKADAAPIGVELPKRAGMGNARPATAIDALAARMGHKPAGHHVAEAEAKAKSAGIKLSRQDRQAAECRDDAEARRAAGKTPVEGVSRMNAANRAIFDAAANGVLPPAPDFSAPTHERYRGKLGELVALVAKGDVAALKAYYINTISTSPKALDRYRNAAVIALTAKAAKRAARASA